MTKPTSITQWKDLVSDASNLCQIYLPEDLESYLVFLLMRFMTAEQIAKKSMGLELLTSANRSGALRSLALRDVGDQCLIYSGLFPARARRKLVRVSYYVNIGKSAYLLLATNSKEQDCNLFTTLSNKFVYLMDILQAMREIDGGKTILDPLMAEELWHDTGSAHALHILKQFTVSTNMPITYNQYLANKH